MTSPVVFVTREIADAALAALRDACQVVVWTEQLPPTHKELTRRVADASALLSLLTDPIDSVVMDHAPKLRVISNMAVGVDNIDLAAATARGIPVGNTPGVLTDATADLAFALLLAAGRRVVEAERFVRAGKWRTWEPRLLLGSDLEGACLGLVGFGSIGRAVARRAEGFGLRVLFCDPGKRAEFGAIPADLSSILREADFLSLHVPLTEETHHLINAHTLNSMKSTAIIVNTSRGGVIDHEALQSALQERRIAAAALDVTEPEPLPKGHPLLNMDNCLVVPHIGSASRRTRERMAMMAAENVLAGLRGERLPHCANPDVYR